MAAEVANRLVQEGSGVSAGLSQAPEVQEACRVLQDLVDVSGAEEPPPPAMGSHNSELFPELDSQAIPEDMQAKVSAFIEAGTEERERER